MNSPFISIDLFDTLPVHVAIVVYSSDGDNDKDGIPVFTFCFPATNILEYILLVDAPLHETDPVFDLIPKVTVILVVLLDFDLLFKIAFNSIWNIGLVSFLLFDKILSLNSSNKTDPTVISSSSFSST